MPTNLTKELETIEVFFGHAYCIYSLFVMDPGKEENYRPMSGTSSPYTFSAPFLTFISGLESILYPTAGPARPTPAAQPYTVLLRMAGKNGEGTLWDSNSYEVFDSNLRRPLLR